MHHVTLSQLPCAAVLLATLRLSLVWIRLHIGRSGAAVMLQKVEKIDEMPNAQTAKLQATLSKGLPDEEVKIRRQNHYCHSSLLSLCSNLIPLVSVLIAGMADRKMANAH